MKRTRLARNGIFKGRHTSRNLTLAEARAILRKESKANFKKPLSFIITSVAANSILKRKRDGVEQYNKAVEDFKLKKIGIKRIVK